MDKVTALFLSTLDLLVVYTAVGHQPFRDREAEVEGR